MINDGMKIVIYINLDIKLDYKIIYFTCKMTIAVNKLFLGDETN